MRSAGVAAGVAAGIAMSIGELQAQDEVAKEYYQLRKYTLRTGPHLTLMQQYFEHALIPKLNRMGMDPIGAFKLDIGPETPTLYLLIPATSIETLITLDLRLSDDAAFLKAGAGFWSAPASAPACLRVESSLMSAFKGWPKLTAPEDTKRIFQLRTYESATDGGHRRKVEMFNSAEIRLFTKAGFTPVFFGDVLVGNRLPALTYMLTFSDVADLSAKWAAFGSDPAWKELSSQPQNQDIEIVSNISNLYLSPLACSQI